eukprot:CAMPEP_0118722864 /NCGR_PEP_ID=MMETSP0800-20121206/31666_1 /TAXON_ID=210618 ORGANISM="Striatella unipunctata, Strain CCMP2910" /NCGR_SAMPLE_ID=MMETSP0800 /ASSEMBLY_ACC=CAM_ASM_000638 /LENGTH=588 /DNA_ID=CAMNT_0006631189 /DNA_START=51 /DNA_END=1817 /DNA_ORIENTATION=+
MGHARTYLGFDIIRRILQDHFHYNVLLVMNITDIDDKIIERSNENGIHHLELTRKFEAEFHRDMQALGVSPPDVLTRVTEYMEEIVVYIEQIIKKGLAYESNGSVYFDVKAFEAVPECHYCNCKLAPEQIHNATLLAEGEGKLTQDFVGDKKSPRDWALWKKTKDSEKNTSWDSPWGPGRPGWHIECSVMASDVFERLNDGDPRMDIHSGGVDLKFPHHDNEMAQAEAHSGCTQWVNYFVHAGHLEIKGFKMSKSLKNFITIEQALEAHTARQVRLCFLLHKYNASMDYGDNTMSHALVYEKMFVEFFHNVKAFLRDQDVLGSSQKWNDATQKLTIALTKTQNSVDAALRDDFDTPAAMTALVDLLKTTNPYLEERSVVALAIRRVALYLTHMFRVFGLIQSGGQEIGFPVNSSGSGDSEEQILTPVLNALLEFRSKVRDCARQKDVGGVLSECDAFRDDALPELGIRLEDKSSGSVWKLASPEELLREREQKKQEEARRLAEKEKAAAEKAKKDALNKLSPADFMKQLTADVEGKEIPKYSQFDESTGMPTHFHTGEPLNKSQTKTAQKEFNNQKKKYEKYLKQQEK